MDFCYSLVHGHTTTRAWETMRVAIYTHQQQCNLLIWHVQSSKRYAVLRTVIQTNRHPRQGPCDYMTVQAALRRRREAGSRSASYSRKPPCSTSPRLMPTSKDH